jgi:hypothetical protein
MLTASVDGQVGWMLTHEADLGPYGRKIDAYSYTEPRLQWEAVNSKNALFRSFNARNIEEIIYDEEERQSNASDDVDGDKDNDDNGSMMCMISTKQPMALMATVTMMKMASMSHMASERQLMMLMADRS